MKQKTAIISGGAGGLGIALAELLVNRGWHLVLIDLPGTGLEAAREKFSDAPVSLYGCDLTDETAVEKLCREIIKERDPIDLVIYNAGITQIAELGTESVAAHRKVFEVNYYGSLYLLLNMISSIRQSKGLHLAISSVAGFSPLYHRAAYSASKHALEGLFKSLRAEELEHGVKVSIASPSFVATNIGNPDHQAGGIARPGSAQDGVDYMSPEDAAAEILAGIEKHKSYIPIGRIARLAWRVNRYFPELYFKLMMRQMKK